MSTTNADAGASLAPEGTGLGGADTDAQTNANESTFTTQPSEPLAAPKMEESQLKVDEDALELLRASSHLELVDKDDLSYLASLAVKQHYTDGECIHSALRSPPCGRQLWSQCH